ncbi:MAG TPA: hypothetical protein VF773_04280 [Verrucomicrobiae bacterium]
MTKLKSNSLKNRLLAPSLRFSITLLAISALFFAGCNSKPAPANASAPAETYLLTKVDGQSVPCSVNHNGAAFKVNSGTLTFRSDGHCQSSIELISPAGKKMQKNVSATYTRNTDSIAFKWKGAGKTKATLNGDLLTMNNEGMNFSYQRQP